MAGLYFGLELAQGKRGVLELHQFLAENLVFTACLGTGRFRVARISVEVSPRLLKPCREPAFIQTIDPYFAAAARRMHEAAFADVDADM